MRNNIYYIDIDDATKGMEAISLVDLPAVGYNFLKFKEENGVKLAFNEEQHIITGVVCLADTPIVRYSDDIGVWYCVFTKDVIKKMIIKYSKDNSWNRINLQHDGKLVEGVYMIESYIKDTVRGIAPIEFVDVPDGSWLVSFYVENQQLWEDIKNSKELNGFSLEGFFNLIPAPVEHEQPKSEEVEKDELNDLLNSIFDVQE